MESNLPTGAGGSQNLEQTASDTAIETKRKTVENLKAFEAKKAEASASLQAKLAAFQATLSEAEKSALGSLMDLSDSSNLGTAVVKEVGGMEVSIFLKPMQRANGGTEVSVFLKPQQIAEPDVSVFLKPQQIAEPDVSVFLKPQQIAEPDEAVFLKPMQIAEPDEAVFLKPMQV